MKHSVQVSAAAAVIVATITLYRMGSEEETGKPPPRPTQAAATREVIASPGEASAIAIRLSPDTGFATFRVNEAWLTNRGEAVEAQVRVACRYLPEKDQWQRIAASPTRIAYRMEPRTEAEAKGEERLFYELPRETGLFWVYWIETVEGNMPGRIAVQHTELVTASSAQCAPVAPNSTPEGKVGACVPTGSKVEAHFVADPSVACAEQR